MKPRHIYISIFAVLFFGFLLSKNYLAERVMARGHYYFNGPSCVKTSAGEGCYDLKKAEQAYRIAVFLKPKILWGHYQLARIYFVKGEKEKALEEINNELKANPENLRSLYVRGLIYGYSGKLSEAEADFKKFIAWSPTEWAGYNDLAWILAKQGKYSEVEKTIKTAMLEIPQADKNVWLLNSLGVAQLNLKKYKEAEKTFESAQKLAQNLTLAEWAHAYPGNDPSQVAGGLEAFRRAVDFNLEKSKQ